MTIAEEIDADIQATLEFDNTQVIVHPLLMIFDELPSSVSKEEYREFVKRNLALYSKLILEQIDEGLK